MHTDAEAAQKADELRADAFTLGSELHLMHDRDKSAPVRVRLAPGASLRHEVNPEAWAMRPVNGARPLPEGPLGISVRYEVPADPTAWTGRLVAGPVAGEFGR